MPLPKVRQMTLVIAPRGGTIHITSLGSPGRTACNKRCNGWRVAPVAKPYAPRVNCDGCKEALFFPVRAAGEGLAEAPAKNAHGKRRRSRRVS